jgi:hypothetical protein
MKKINHKQKPKITVLKNPLNSDEWFCDDYSFVKNIDGISYITVYKPDNTARTFLMRKDVLKVTSSSYG